MDKYGGVALDVRVLHQMATALNAGQVPMNFGHSSLEPIAVRNVHASVIQLDGEHVVEATFDVDEDAWAAVETRFAGAGVTGGFSFTASETQIAASSGDPRVTLSADAAAFTDNDRAEAWRLLEATAPSEVSRLYQFDAHEIFRVIVDVWTIAGPFIVNIASSGIYDALKLLASRHQDPTVVEIHEHRADGSHSTAVIRTSDPEILRTALESMADRPSSDLAQFDPETKRWLASPPNGE